MGGDELSRLARLRALLQQERSVVVDDIFRFASCGTDARKSLLRAVVAFLSCSWIHRCWKSRPDARRTIAIPSTSTFAIRCLSTIGTAFNISNDGDVAQLLARQRKDQLDAGWALALGHE